MMFKFKSGWQMAAGNTLFSVTAKVLNQNKKIKCLNNFVPINF